jgi:hypothetical protein
MNTSSQTLVQPKSAKVSERQSVASIRSDIQDTKISMSRRFGNRQILYDFTSDRIHIGHHVNTLNDCQSGQAYTTGSDIFFFHGPFKYGSGTGDRLLAHELNYVLQQYGAHARLQPRSESSTMHVQRAGKEIDLESKPNYFSVIFGAKDHSKLEECLCNKGSELLTEASIPGATRNNSSNLNQVGFAGLYNSTQASTVAGVQISQGKISGLIKQLDVAATKAFKERGIEPTPAKEQVEKTGGAGTGEKVSPQQNIALFGVEKHAMWVRVQMDKDPE